MPDSTNKLISAIQHYGKLLAQKKHQTPECLKAGKKVLAVIKECKIENSLNKIGTNPGAQFTPLIAACMISSEPVVRQLVTEGADINMPGIDGETPLIAACKVKLNKKVIGQLLSLGAEPNKADQKGLTPLMHAYLADSSNGANILNTHDNCINLAGAAKKLDLFATIPCSSLIDVPLPSQNEKISVPALAVAQGNIFFITTMLDLLYGELELTQMFGHTTLPAQEAQNNIQDLVRHADGADVKEKMLIERLKEFESLSEFPPYACLIFNLITLGVTFEEMKEVLPYYDRKVIPAPETIKCVNHFLNVIYRIQDPLIVYMLEALEIKKLIALFVGFYNITYGEEKDKSGLLKAYMEKNKDFVESYGVDNQFGRRAELFNQRKMVEVVGYIVFSLMGLLKYTEKLGMLINADTKMFFGNLVFNLLPQLPLPLVEQEKMKADIIKSISAPFFNPSMIAKVNQHQKDADVLILSRIEAEIKKIKSSQSGSNHPIIEAIAISPEERTKNIRQIIEENPEKINTPDATGLLPIDLAVERKNLNDFIELFKAGAKVDFTKKENGSTITQRLALGGGLNMLRLLLAGNQSDDIVLVTEVCPNAKLAMQLIAAGISLEEQRKLMKWLDSDNAGISITKDLVQHTCQLIETKKFSSLTNRDYGFLPSSNLIKLFCAAPVSELEEKKNLIATGKLDGVSELENVKNLLKHFDVGVIKKHFSGASAAQSDAKTKGNQALLNVTDILIDIQQHTITEYFCPSIYCTLDIIKLIDLPKLNLKHLNSINAKLDDFIAISRLCMQTTGAAYQGVYSALNEMKSTLTGYVKQLQEIESRKKAEEAKKRQEEEQKQKELQAKIEEEERIKLAEERTKREQEKQAKREEQEKRRQEEERLKREDEERKRLEDEKIKREEEKKQKAEQSKREEEKQKAELASFAVDKIKFEAEKKQFATEKLLFEAEQKQLIAEKLAFKSEKEQLATEKLAFEADKNKSAEAKLAFESEKIKFATAKDRLVKEKDSLDEDVKSFLREKMKLEEDQLKFKDDKQKLGMAVAIFDDKNKKLSAAIVKFRDEKQKLIDIADKLKQEKKAIGKAAEAKVKEEASQPAVPAMSFKDNEEIKSRIKQIFKHIPDGMECYLGGSSVAAVLTNSHADDYDFVGKGTEQEMQVLMANGFYRNANLKHIHLYSLRNPYTREKSDFVRVFNDKKNWIEEYAMNRDFTRCAVFYCNRTKQFIDPTGRGLADIKAGVLSMIGDEEVFYNDPVRLLRAIRFIATGEKPDNKLVSALKQWSNRYLLEKDDNELNHFYVKFEEYKLAYPNFINRLKEYGLLDKIEAARLIKPGTIVPTPVAIFHSVPPVTQQWMGFYAAPNPGIGGEGQQSFPGYSQTN